MVNKRPCYRCHGAKTALDYDESKKQNKDVFCDCRMCNGKGYIYEDENSNQLFQKFDETEDEFLERIKDL